jgi:flagellar hook-length control protein FliK
MPQNNGTGQAVSKTEQGHNSSKFSLLIEGHTNTCEENLQRASASLVEQSTTDNNPKKVCKKSNSDVSGTGEQSRGEQASGGENEPNPSAVSSCAGQTAEQISSVQESNKGQKTDGSKGNSNQPALPVIQDLMKLLENITENTAEKGPPVLPAIHGLMKSLEKITEKAAEKGPVEPKSISVLTKLAADVTSPVKLTFAPGQIKQQGNNQQPTGSQSQDVGQNSNLNAGNDKVLLKPNQGADSKQSTAKPEVITQNQHITKSLETTCEAAKAEKPGLQSSGRAGNPIDQVMYSDHSKEPKETEPGERQATVTDGLNKIKPDGFNQIDTDTQNNREAVTEKTVQKIFDAVQMQSESKQNKDNSANDKNGSQGPVVHINALNIPKEQNTEPINTAISNQKTAQPNNTSISEQIGESIQSSLQQGIRQITIRLNPPQLGSVSIKFEQKDGQITGLLEVSRSQTREEIQQALPALIKNLADAGITLKRLDVVLTSQHQQQNYGNNFSSSSQFMNHTGSNQNNSFKYSSTQQGISTPEYEEMLVTDKSINMLI